MEFLNGRVDWRIILHAFTLATYHFVCRELRVSSRAGIQGVEPHSAAGQPPHVSAIRRSGVAGLPG